MWAWPARVWMRDYEVSLQRRREAKVCFLSLTMVNMVSPEGSQALTAAVRQPRELGDANEEDLWKATQQRATGGPRRAFGYLHNDEEKTSRGDNKRHKEERRAIQRRSEKQTLPLSSAEKNRHADIYSEALFTPQQHLVDAQTPDSVFKNRLVF